MLTVLTALYPFSRHTLAAVILSGTYSAPSDFGRCNSIRYSAPSSCHALLSVAGTATVCYTPAATPSSARRHGTRSPRPHGSRRHHRGRRHNAAASIGRDVRVGADRGQPHLGASAPVLGATAAATATKAAAGARRPVKSCTSAATAATTEKDVAAARYSARAFGKGG